MNAQALSHFPMPWLTCIALVIFVAVFALIFMTVYRSSNAELYRRLERLPLHEGERHE